MGLVALTNISHAVDGKPTTIEVNTPVSETQFTKVQWEQLKADGAVGIPAAKAGEVADENEQLRREIEALKAKLAAATKPATPTTK